MERYDIRLIGHDEKLTGLTVEDCRKAVTDFSIKGESFIVTRLSDGRTTTWNHGLWTQ